MTNLLRTLAALLLLTAFAELHAEQPWQGTPEGGEQLRLEIKSRIENNRFDGEALLQKGRVKRFYAERDYRSGWVEGDGVSGAAQELLTVLGEATEEGLPAGGYHQQALRTLLEGVPRDAATLARLDLLLSDAFLAYSLDVRRGRFDPRSVDDSWYIAPVDFDVEKSLRYALESRSVLSSLHSMPPYQSGYRRLRRALHDYRLIVAQGGWPQLAAGQPLQRGMRGARVTQLRQRLRSSGDLPVAVADESDDFDPFLEMAVRRFQHRHGLVEDGVVGEGTRAALNVPVERRIGQLLANMERWRWLPRHIEPHYLMVNMTGFHLDVMEEDRSVMRMRVVIGSDYRQTPVFGSQITEIVFNPSWYVPATVFRHDLLPLLREDSSYLQRHNMKVLTELQAGGNVVDPATIEWQRYETERFPYVVRQEPGAGNPLGLVKFVIPNQYGIYLHDTSHRELFAERERTFSSGCIRLERPLALANYLLRYEPGMEEGDLSPYLSRQRTAVVKLTQRWPIYLLYWTAWVDEDGVVQFRDDVYNRDTRLLTQLPVPQPRDVAGEARLVAESL